MRQLGLRYLKWRRDEYNNRRQLEPDRASGDAHRRIG